MARAKPLMGRFTRVGALKKVEIYSIISNIFQDIASHRKQSDMCLIACHSAAEPIQGGKI